jgi:formaldehyde-activating enzyme involved in methanogenesis
VLSMSKLIKLNANDTVSIYFYNNSATQLAGTTPMYTYFEGFLVSAS